MYLPSIGGLDDNKYMKPSRRLRSNEQYTLLSFVLFSWLIYLLSGSSNQVIQKLELEMSQEKIRVSETRNELKEMRLSKNQASTTLKKTKRTRAAFQHELKMVEEMKDDGERVIPAPRGDEKLMTNWVNRRMGILESKIDSLQRYIHEDSKIELLHKYGPGPYRAKITVEYLNKRKKTEKVDFTVELAPADTMPHSNLFFLEMVKNGVWNDTVFLHHDKLEHLLAAAPVDFEKQNMKFHNLYGMTWETLGYPEYSTSYPHKKYTLGFAYVGPTFYINTLDNTEAHGPNGQGHHKLPGDADPCFATVVEGETAVDRMIQAGSYQLKLGENATTPYGEQDHSMTHIISIEIV